MVQSPLLDCARAGIFLIENKQEENRLPIKPFSHFYLKQTFILFLSLNSQCKYIQYQDMAMLWWHAALIN